MPKKSRKTIKKIVKKGQGFSSKKKQVYKTSGKRGKQTTTKKGAFTLPKPMEFDTHVRSGKNFPIVENRYVFEKGVDKGKVDAAIKKQLQTLLRTRGKISFQVNYMIDKVYTSGFQTATNMGDIEKMSFSSNMFRDYQDEEIYDHHTKILEAGIFLIEEKTKHSKMVGCTNETNDCLYDAIMTGFGKKKPEVLESAEIFKDWLGVDRKDLIHIKLVPKIEKKLKVNINLCGSHQYVNDKVKYPRSMTIRIWKGHVERVFAISEYKQLKYGYNEWFKGRKYPIFYKKLTDGTIKLCRLENVKDGNPIVWHEDLSFLDKFYQDKKLADTYFLKEVDQEKEKNEVGKTVYVLPEPEDVIENKVEEWVLFQRATYQQLKGRASGACNLLSQKVNCAVLNAGDGRREHPTQALLDALTIINRKKKIEGLKVAICGDILHSRVARSNIYLLTMLGAEVNIVAPSNLMPKEIEKFGVNTFTDMKKGLMDCDIVMMLRLQNERMTSSFLSSNREYYEYYGLTPDKLDYAKPDAIIMHPGPMNRGLEISAESADSHKSVVLAQVANGVLVRMAVLYQLLGGATLTGEASV